MTGPAARPVPEAPAAASALPPGGRPARGEWVELTGWGRLPRERCRLLRASRASELRALLAERDGGTLLPRGLGRSYGDAALNAGGAVVETRGLDRLRAFDPETGLLECEAGVSLGELARLFLPRGFFPPVVPGTRFVTLGGALAANVHGKNHHRAGGIGRFVEWIEILLPDGELRRCSRTEDPELFLGTLGGMGLTGVIVAAALRLRPVESGHLRVSTRRAPDLDAALRLFEEEDDRFEYSAAWIDCLGRGRSLGRSVLLRGDHAGRADAPGPVRIPRAGPRVSVPFELPSGLVAGWSVRAMNALYYALHREGEGVAPLEGFFWPLDAVGHWNRGYGRRGFVQYQAAVPRAEGPRALVRLLEAVSAAGRGSFLSVLKAFGPDEGGPLSFPIEGYTVTFDLPAGGGLAELGARLDAIVLEHGGRVYLAKDALLDAGRFAAMYPEHARFRALRERVDPERRLASSLARRVGLVAP